MTVASTRPDPAATPGVTAIETREAPVIDGRTADPIWATAQAITAFRQSQPREDAEPSFPTEARVAFDARYLYVLVRAYDTAPDSIVALLSRRDVPTASDRITLRIDSYHDRKSGFLFSVTASGVKSDAAIINDMQEDRAWDGIWDVSTRIDELGWVAEFRIPFGQLRYPAGEEHTFGFGITRDVARSGESMSWPLYRRSQPGIASQLAELNGLRGLGGGDRIALMPYTVMRDRPGPAGQSIAGGLDATASLGAGLTLDATVNPDFGQVEADPSVLNLGAFETLYEERRPFFLENAGLFRYDITCGGPACNGLFYSRRIGRAPQLAGVYPGVERDRTVPILGAAKLTGRPRPGLSVGVLGAVTGQMRGDSGRTVEPLTGYGVLRAQQDWRGGRSNAGLMLTMTHRELDEWSRDYLRSNALVVGADMRHRFRNNTFMFRAYAAASHVTGSEEAIARTQRSASRYYQRPDDAHEYDPTRTALDGMVAAASLGKVGGVVRYSSAFRYTSGGFEPNDVGFLYRSDHQIWQNAFGLVLNRPTRLYRQAGLNTYLYSSWNSSGQPLGVQAIAQGQLQLHSQWWLRAGVQVDPIGVAYDDRATRGGPAIRRDRETFFWGGIEGDGRRGLVPELRARGMARNAAGTRGWGFDPGLSYRVGDRVRGMVGLSYLRHIEDQQWVGNLRREDGTTRYTFARVDQHIGSLTTRLDVTATPTLSFQLYASPFVAAGRHSRGRELADPRASRPEDRYRALAAGEDVSKYDFNIKEFRANAVVRWEYRPGSVLYLVWSQGRSEYQLDRGSFDPRRDLGSLFRVRPQNAIAIKVSYRYDL